MELRKSRFLVTQEPPALGKSTYRGSLLNFQFVSSRILQAESLFFVQFYVAMMPYHETLFSAVQMSLKAVRNFLYRSLNVCAGVDLECNARSIRFRERRL